MPNTPAIDWPLADRDIFERRVLRFDEMYDAELAEILCAEIPEEYRYNTADIPN
jgi:hypothetical protein